MACSQIERSFLAASPNTFKVSISCFSSCCFEMLDSLASEINDVYFRLMSLLLGLLVILVEL